jgi:tight adherence protein B
VIGGLVGLGAAAGLLLMLHAIRTPATVRPPRTSASRLGDLIARSGIDGVTPRRLIAACAGVGVVVLVLAVGISRTWTIAVAFAVLASYAPIALVRRRAQVRTDELRGLWPDVVDNLTSAVRAGLSLPEALAQVGERGPEAMREPFRRFASDYRVSGRFGECLDHLKADLADPVGDRLVEAVRVARDVGGHDLGRLLRTLSTFLRDDLRTRGEMQSRQTWTVNGARLAVAAPWVLLGLLALRPEAVAAYDSGAGAVVLGIGAALCVVAYRLMLKVGRLPDEQRVLR